MRGVRSGLLAVGFVLLQGQSPHQRVVGPGHLSEFGANEVAEKSIAWGTIGFIALWATVVVAVLVLWYRQLRFREDLEGGRPRMPEDEG
jgi:hypothetical protein